MSKGMELVHLSDEVSMSTVRGRLMYNGLHQTEVIGLGL